MTGTVSICSTCGISMDGRGFIGGPTNSSVNQPGYSGSGSGSGYGGDYSPVSGGGGAGGSYGIRGARRRRGHRWRCRWSHPRGLRQQRLHRRRHYFRHRFRRWRRRFHPARRRRYRRRRRRVPAPDRSRDPTRRHHQRPGLAGAVGVSKTGQTGGAGGAGSGGGVWLTAPQISGPGGVDVDGGPAVGTGNFGGSAGVGRIRIDADYLNLPTFNPAANTFSRHTSGRITAYSYDADNRLLDTVRGASSTDAAASGLVSLMVAVTYAPGCSMTQTATLSGVSTRVPSPPQQPRLIVGLKLSPFMTRMDE